MTDTLQTVLWIAIATSIAIAGVRTFWRVRSIVRVWRSEERPMHSVTAVIWRDPGDVASLDLAAGPGGVDGRPQAPFTFAEEHMTGSRPSVSVVDGRGLKWRIKWGDEVQVEALATRLAWAAGYFVETTHFVPEGTIARVPALQRAASAIGPDGAFCDARFELDEEGVIKHFDEHSWAWTDNPFVGTRELNGFKVVMMWLSNWDAKDRRDVARGSNTAIFEYPVAGGPREARYLVIDWGGALGRWGSVVRRGRWNAEQFAAESDSLVQGVDGEMVRFGYTGQHTADIAEGIRVSDVRWLMRILGRLTDGQIASAVAASGGTPEEVTSFTRALRARLDRLSEAAGIQRVEVAALPNERRQ